MPGSSYRRSSWLPRVGKLAPEKAGKLELAAKLGGRQHGSRVRGGGSARSKINVRLEVGGGRRAAAAAAGY
jgi:hypothetical protein